MTGERYGAPTDQGKTSLICDGYRCRVDKMLKSQLNWAMPFPICVKMGKKSGAKLSYNLSLNCPTKALDCPSPHNIYITSVT